MIAARRHLIGHAALWVLAILNLAGGFAVVTSEGWSGPSPLQWVVFVTGTALSLVVALLSQIHHHQLAMITAWVLGGLYLVSRFIGSTSAPLPATVVIQQLFFATLTVGGAYLASRSTPTKP